MDIPLLEKTKIQAQVLVPLVKALRAELGEARADAIVRKALGEQFRRYGEKFWQRQGERNLGDKLANAFDGFAAGDALDEPELGFLLVCGSDFPMTEGFGAPVELKRTQTIMQGASHCDFRYALKAGKQAT
jgi:hypothetical protein